MLARDQETDTELLVWSNKLLFHPLSLSPSTTLARNTGRDVGVKAGMWRSRWARGETPCSRRGGWAAAAASLAICILAIAGWVRQASAEDSELSSYEKQWEPFWGKRLTGYLPARDGTQLRYSVLLPDGDGPFPVVVKYSGYDSGSIGGKAYLVGNETFSVSLDKTLVENGYAVMGVSARGTGCSEGRLSILGPDYGLDGRDAIEFAASQVWSSGNIGMASWSWGGISQLMTASERPPHLKAIAPGMATGDGRRDAWAPGGVPAPAFDVGWEWLIYQRWDAVRTSAIEEKDNQCLTNVAKNLEDARRYSVFYQSWKHPLRDDWMSYRELSSRTAQIQVPVLAMEAWQDEAVGSRQDYYVDSLPPENAWLVQTNGGHNLYVSLTFRKKLISFFDRFLKNEQNGFENTPRVEIWAETTSDLGEADERKRDEESAPSWIVRRGRLPVQVDPVAFHFDENGALSPNGPRSTGSDQYDYPVTGPEVNSYAAPNSWGKINAAWREGSLAYTSTSLEDDLLAYGPASADLWLAADPGPDLDLQVTLTQLLANGQEVYVQRGWLRMSNRKLDAGRATELLPWLADRPDTIEPIYAGEPNLARIELPKFSHVFRKGSRLRLWIDAPSTTGGFGFDIFSMPTKVSILYGRDHPSRLVIGKLSGVSVPPAQPLCGTQPNQPCRADPLAN